MKRSPVPVEPILGPGWTVLVPLKALGRAKTRLTGVDAHQRRSLVVAMARDALEALQGANQVSEVWMLGGDHDTVHEFDGLWRRAVLDTRASDLNAALRHGALLASRRRPRSPLAVVMPDLPALTADSVDAVLRAAAGYPRSFVPDDAGRGTTVLSTLDPCDLRPSFGDDSARRHRTTGAVELRIPAATGVRCDVDRLEDLAPVRGLGVGAATGAELRKLQLPTSDAGVGASRAAEA